MAALVAAPLFFSAAWCQTTTIPPPSGYPLTITAENDPIIALKNSVVSMEQFQAIIADVIAKNPIVGQRIADGVGAIATRREARSALFPSIDMRINSSRALARNFSNDPDNFIEQSRGNGRVDATANIQQLLYDFGATGKRIEAAAARIEGAEAEVDRASEALALRAIGAWYDVFAYTQLVNIADQHVRQLEILIPTISFRITQGVSAPIDRIRLNSAISSARSQHANFMRQYNNAEARYSELFKSPPAAAVLRIPPPAIGHQSSEAIALLALKSPLVKSAEADARASMFESKASRAATLPTVTADIDAGRYGLFEPGRTDYDVRARITVRQQLLGPGAARAEQARARADAARMRAEVTRDEAVREATIAWSDVQALDTISTAREEDYIASRQLRDAENERFTRTRGTLFDVLEAQERTFAAAAFYLQTISELDTSRYVLLAHSGQLLDKLGILPTISERFR